MLSQTKSLQILVALAVPGCGLSLQSGTGTVPELAAEDGYATVV